MYSFTVGSICALLCLAVAPPVQGALDDQVNAPVDVGTFSKPSSLVRPRFRYWLPDASVDPEIVAADITSAAAIGAGGVEFLPFFEYGGGLGQMPPGANWSTYNFGTAPFRTLMKTALETHDRHGLVMDFALGPNQGQGVPARADDEGLQWDLIPITASVPHNGSFSGIVPGWGIGKLVSFVSALVVSNQTLQYEASGLAGLANVTYDQYVLAHDSLTEHTGQVSKDSGQVKLTFPPASNGSSYRVFSFFERRSLHANLKFTRTRDTTIFDNGSFVVDHFSKRGAETVIQFWEEHMLQDGIRELLKKVGNYAWEDSIEAESNISWTPSLPSRFEKKFGYSIKPMLPLLTFKQNNLGLQQDKPGPFQCLLDTPDAGVGYVNDFHATLADGYLEYLDALTAWSHDALGSQLSVQPAYNLPIDMQALIPAVNAPECESLGFEDLVDAYRIFTGPANLAGTRVISNELGAVRNSGFQYKVPDLLFAANRGFAGGVNQYVIHGQAYTGGYFATTWPGHVAFRYLFSEPWSKKEPVWDHGLHEALDYLARVQYVQQVGVPKLDVAIYLKETSPSYHSGYPSSDLIAKGWTYNYLSPDNLVLKQASIRNAILAPNGPAYKAFVIESSRNVTVEAVRTFKNYAAAGLPIIFSGGLPSFYPSRNGSNKAVYDNELAALLTLDNVYAVATGQVSRQLYSLGLQPRTRLSTNETWYTTWRETNKVIYVLVLSDLAASQGEIVVASTKKPFYLNPWTGKTSPVLFYEQDDQSTIIRLNMAANQTIIIAFADKLGCHPIPTYHVTSVPQNVLGSNFNPQRGISLHVAQSAVTTSARLSNGQIISLDATSVPPSLQLSNWSLTAERWEAPSNVSDGSLPTIKYNTTYELAAPTAWRDIPALVNSSGIGYYTTTFQWPPARGSGANSTVDGAYISFSRVLNVVQVEVNGHKVPPMDVTNAFAEISPYLQNGANKVIAVVPTTWWNHIRTIMGRLSTSGTAPLPTFLESYAGIPLAGRDESGLVGTVIVTPYRTVFC